MSDLGVLVRQLQGEVWHEVGAAGEPGFQSGWSNVSGTSATVAFKLLLPTLFAMKGAAAGGASGTPIFTIPAWDHGYRRVTFALTDGGVQYPCTGVIDATGNVIPFAGGGAGALDAVGLEVLVAL